MAEDDWPASPQNSGGFALRVLRESTIMVADPDKTVRDTLSLWLADRVGRFFGVTDGKAAVEACMHVEPDVVLCCVNLAELDGSGLATFLLETLPSTQIILIGSIGELTACLRLGTVSGAPMLAKPLTPRPVIGALTRAAMAARGMRQSRRLTNLTRYFMDAQPSFSILLHGNEIEYINRAMLCFLGYRSFEEYTRSGRTLTAYVTALDGEEPSMPVNNWLRALADDPLDVEHTIRMLHPEAAQSRIRLFQANIASLARTDRFIATLTDVTELDDEREIWLGLASTDPLTKTFNRRRMLEILGSETTHADSGLTTVSVILFDIDHFKSVNDTYGHDAGDAVLTKLSAVAARTIRAADCLARFGGEEFLIITPGSGIKEAMACAERVRKAVEDMDFVNPNRITASFGVAEYVRGESIESLIKRADEALYKAKTSGRNRVEEAGRLAENGNDT